MGQATEHRTPLAVGMGGWSVLQREDGYNHSGRK
jgi:hypothetical protein